MRVTIKATAVDSNSAGICDQAITDGQQCVALAGFADRHPVTEGSDGETADDVDEQNENARDGVAAGELARTVHGAVEVGFRSDVGATRACLVLRDQTGVEIGVDGHLFTGHGVQGESGADFRDTAGALGDHHEVDDGQDDEHHDTDGEVAADDEFTERLDDAASRSGAAVSIQQHDSR